MILMKNYHDDYNKSGDDDVHDDSHHHVILNSKKVYIYIYSIKIIITDI